KMDKNKVAQIIKNDKENLILKALEDKKNLEIVLENLSSQDLITYIPSNETIVPLDSYEEYINEAPQVVYTTLHSLDGIDYTNQSNEFLSFENEGENINVYKTNFNLNQIPFVEGQYYVLVHSKLEDQILNLKNS
ncbi:MAG: hypothetical protein K2H85_07055, partial [Allobaculum sp.]|nr:hypothetical protein [Allobaculum sp.]